MCAPNPNSLHAAFLLILPRIELHAQIYHRDTPCPDRRQDQIAETVALAYQWFVRLARRGKDASQFVSALAGFAARAVRSGRRLTGQEKAKDVLSPRAQRQYGFKVECLPASTATAHESLYGETQGQRQLDEFEERLQDNRQTPVPDQAAFRIDFRAWLRSLSPRERRMIRAMSRNERTKDLSKQFELSPARISQMRRQFHDEWEAYCGDQPAVAGT